MLPILCAFGGTAFVVLGLQSRRLPFVSAAIRQYTIIGGILGLSVVYYGLAWQVPLWIRIGTPLGALAGGVVANLRIKLLERKRRASV